MYTGKAVIVGDGLVGSTIAYTLTLSRLFSRISLIDIDKDKAEGDALDISHGISFLNPVKVLSEDYDTCRDADIIIISAGVAQKSGETRIDLLKRNFEVFSKVISDITKYCSSEAVFLVVTNPVDILTYVTKKLSGFPENQVIGTGTVLDSSRLKYLLSTKIGVDIRDVTAYIIGEHGDGEVFAHSLCNISGIGLDMAMESFGKNEVIDLDAIHKKVINSAYEIIEKKGATYYAVAMAVKRIVEAIVRDERSVLTVSSVSNSHFGNKDVALSLPTVVGKGGIKGMIKLNLTKEEEEGVLKSISLMRSLLSELGM